MKVLQLMVRWWWVAAVTLLGALLLYHLWKSQVRVKAIELKLKEPVVQTPSH